MGRGRGGGGGGGGGGGWGGKRGEAVGERGEGRFLKVKNAPQCPCVHNDMHTQTHNEPLPNSFKCEGMT